MIDNRRWAMLIRPKVRYALIVLVPVFVCALYFALLSSDGYISRASLIVERDSKLSGPNLELGLLSLGNEPTRQDALVVQEFMTSRAMLEFLESKLNLRAHYSDDSIDFVQRLAKDASREDFLEYYRSRLNVKVDEESHILSVSIVAYTREFSELLMTTLVKRSEDFVNEISHGLAQEQLEFMLSEVNQANERLKKASRALIELQREYEIFSPEKETEAVGIIIAGLLQELARQRTELKALTSYLNEGAPEVVAIKKRIAAIELQLEQERSKQVGSGESGLNDLMLAYQDAQLGVELSSQVYQTALTALEATRLEVTRKVKYLVSVSAPSMPDESEYPRRFYWTLTIFVALNLIYFLSYLIVSAIQDHQS